MIRTHIFKRCVFARLTPIYLYKNYCKDKKDPTAVPPVPASKEFVPVAPKVIAKNPPIKELTGGKIFDPNTKSYQIAKVPSANIPVQKEDTPTKPTPKGILRRKLEAALAAKPPDAKPTTEEPKCSAKRANPTQTNQPPPVGGSNQPPSADSPPPRLIRPDPERVIFCLFPYTWVKAFNNKTGITGFWTFAFTYSTYLLSKEKLVMEHEYYGGLSLIVLSYLAVVYAGPSIAQGIDKEIDAFENSFKQLRIDQQNSFESNIQHEESLQLSMQEQLVLVAAKRENVELQLEEEYRSRQMTVHNRVKEMLDFHIAYEGIERRYAQEQMVRWTLEKVLASVTDDLDSQYVDTCLVELDTMSLKKEAN